MRSDASRPSIVELLAAFGRAMSDRGWRWYVFGAQAAIVYGRPRLTADVDIAVELVGAPVAELLAALARESIVLRFEPSPELLETARLLPLRHAPTGLPVDVVLTGAGLEEEFLERARAVDLGGVFVPIVSAEDLVVMKVLAGRRKDLADVRGVLIEQAGKLDVARIRELLSALESALGDVRLVRRLDRLLRAARSNT